MIDSIDDLKRAFSLLWAGISDSCRSCQDPDCVGYVWVFPEEEPILLDADVPLVQINGENGPTFIDSYRRDASGCIVIGDSKESCQYLSLTGQCLIHDKRPLACYLYPVGPDLTNDGCLVWALHTDCEHIRRIQKYGDIKKIESKIKEIINNISPALREVLLNYWSQVEYISIRPNGVNNFIKIAEV